MTLAIVLRLVHVLAAVLGTGAVATVAITARAAERTASPEATATFLSVARWAGAGLGLVFVTGAGIDFAVGGLHHAAGWFRASGILVLVAGAVLARARWLARAVTDARRDRAQLRTVTLLSWSACAIVAAVVVLMELRPWT
jgi:hypothetical protein